MSCEKVGTAILISPFVFAKNYFNRDRALEPTVPSVLLFFEFLRKLSKHKVFMSIYTLSTLYERPTNCYELHPYMQDALQA